MTSTNYYYLYCLKLFILAFNNLLLNMDTEAYTIAIKALIFILRY